MPPVIDHPPPLFPARPPTTMLATYAWRAYTGPTQSVTNVGNGANLSVIPQAVVAMVWYHQPGPPGPGDPMVRTLEYADIRPYTFRMLDGTTRINNTNMSQQAYLTLIDKIQNNDAYPT